MNELLRFGEALFAWVLQTSWQAGILALVVILAQAVFRRQLTPAWRYGLWLLLVVRLLLPSTPQTSWSIYNVAGLPRALNSVDGPSTAEVSPSAAFARVSAAQDKAEAERTSSVRRGSERQAKVAPKPAGASSGPVESSLSWRRLAFFIWILGTGFFVARLAWSDVRFSHRVGCQPTVMRGPALLLLRACEERLGVSQPVTLIETEEVQSPSVHGLWRKRLLLPEGTFQHFSTDEQRCIVLHELAHIKRRDLEVNWIASLLLAVHWFNPLLWMAFSRMRNDREMACDALALMHLGTGLAEPYGEAIIKVVDQLAYPSKAPGVLALSEDKRRLKERIRMIAAFKGKPRWSAWAALLALGIAVVGLTNASRARPAASSVQQGTGGPITLADRSGAVLPKGIHGKVVDSQGNPIANANVRCQGFEWNTFTDSQGRFSWLGAERPRTFQVRKSGFKTLLTDLLAPSEQETVLRLEHAPVIAGKVIDQETRQPVSEFEVYHVRLLQGPVTPSLSPHEVLHGSAGAFKYSFDYSVWPDSAFLIDAAGYDPILSHLIAGDDGKELDFELTRARPVAGKVLTPTGAPAGKAEVRLWCGQLNINDIPRRHETECDNDGAFSLPTVLDGKVLVYHNSGYAEVPWQDFLATRKVQLAEWGHVKGRWPKPLPKSRRVSLERIRWSGQMNMYTFPAPWRVSSTPINPDGSFEFEEGAPPGEYMLTEWNNLKIDWKGGGNSMMVLASKRVPVKVEAGRTTAVEVPAGRSVVGRIELGNDGSMTNVHLPIVSLRLKQNGPEFKFPALDPSLSVPENFNRWKEYRERVLAYWLSEDGKVRRRAERVYELPAEPDGSFQIDNVTPGAYELHVNAQMWSGKSGPEIRREISVSASSDNSPLDLGTLK
ncbi:MAG TPA: M56 family metallopeptidase [Candidatus Acidoferrum sp.]|jgi:beta-lactamase regulating signal transducer with metallopeptidase domain|nr:M56 family metallopeptidase [Candidatus Acidoferrum sp.]